MTFGSISLPTPPEGTAYALTVLHDVVDAAWNNAATAANSFETKIAAAQTDFLDASNAPHIAAGSVAEPSITEPAVTIPSAINTSDVYADFDTKYLELVAMLSDKFALFRATYFPDEQATYAAAETALSDALANPNGGIPLTVQNQVWEDDRSRNLADANRAVADVTAAFATKRFPLPPGALASATLQIQQKAQDLNAESSRKVAVLSVENFKWAVEKTMALRQAAMGSAVEYIKALASGPDMASRLVNVGYDAQSKLISAASQFYNSRTSAAELTAKVRQFNVSSALTAEEKNQMADLTLIEDKLKALLAEAQSLAQMATSLFNNLHASASASSSDSVSSTV